MSNPAIIAELKRIADAHGGILNPADVVEAARPVDAVLHSRFEWDDSRAAENYRLVQARQLIRVTVEYIGRGNEDVMSKVFVSLTPDRRDGGYRSLVSVMSDAGQRAMLLADALAEAAERFREKYQELTELSEIFAAIKTVTASTRRQRRRVQPAAVTAPA